MIPRVYMYALVIVHRTGRVDGGGVDGAGKKKSNEEELEAEKDKLHAKIGQQAIELDSLRKKSKQLSL